ncbi:MAG: HsdR family type I site-specific deoxyribonuclease [Variovorax sp.]
MSGQDGAQASALHLLGNMGWNLVDAADGLLQRGSMREVLFKTRLVEVLQTRRFDYKGVSYPLSPGGIDQILRELSGLGLADGLLAANECLYAKLAFGITVTEFMPDGRKHRTTVAVIDWCDARANRFDVTQQLRVLSSQGTHQRAPDIVGYVNGIPLVAIEASQPDASGSYSAEAAVLQGIHRHLRNQREDEIPQLFVYVQLLLAVGRADARYGTTHTPARQWAQWRREEEFDEAQVRAFKRRARSEPDAQDRLLVSLLAPARMLDFLRNFVLFDRNAGKIVARHQQFFGVRTLLRRLARRCPDGTREGGVVWHAAGSGKSLTMVFLAKALLLDEALKECRLVVVTDRLQLERQLARNFMAGGAFGVPAGMPNEGGKAANGRDLARRIGRGGERITFALVQKFAIASRLPECRNDSADIVVLVDEGHRSHGGEAHRRMRKALPRAACVAFTGTPLLKDEKTAATFGPIVHAYTTRAAVADRAVTPLLYEERVSELSFDAEAVDRWFDRNAAGLGNAERAGLKKKYRSSMAVHGSAGRIALIAWDIAVHFSENFKKRAPGLKGQVATAAKRDAVRYKQALDATGLVTSAVVISPPDDSATDGPEVAEWWQRNVLDAGLDPARLERQALHDFGTGGAPDLLIVVDRLLTGFDEPRNAVLYIDKPLKGHNLMQAVARVNRPHEAKRCGWLVDYRGVLKALDTAVADYRQLETRTQGGFDLDDLDGLYAEARPGMRPVAAAVRRGGQDEQIRLLLDTHVAGHRVREPERVYLVQMLDGARAGTGSKEAGLAMAQLQASTALEMPGDAAAQPPFSALIESAIARAEAMFDAPRTPYSHRIAQVVETARAEHSLSPQNIESAVRKACSNCSTPRSASTAPAR